MEQPKFTAIHGDCVEEVAKLPDNSIDFSIFSPPFAELYVYSDDIRDMGNCQDYEEFFVHFQFLVKELARVIKSGRLVAVHCMDLPAMKGKDGYIGLKDFSGMLIQSFQKEGFIYHDRITIWKSPVVEMTRTKSIGLLHKTIKKDSSLSRTGIPDYILVFRNAGDNLVPITHQDKDENEENYLPVNLWQKYAEPVWYDINYSDTLQYTSAREEKDEKHICPLQLETIRRCLHLWSNEGDTVLSPFGGIGSEGYESLRLNRNYIGIELKESYYNQMQRNLKRMIADKMQPKLF
ncbi:DNA (cytosine-5-)-methyltransferase [Capnocytophaga sp. oral taxon 863 str. F0517]|uniref:DNA-methyltransferase n=1 Tax=Capnocytophaga sp. oral taxon 863 TaxID=1227265 RepID=UPI0003965C00|nr:site-specific DNA-methyltransferase [Capnocytophaga sp. oral taxon 863]ERI64311.1 DNA (cytosine-5-)-methyltransferase [Capnocytophaga sp. oral taxon 863 str. F0517]